MQLRCDSERNTKYSEKRATRCLPDCRERKVADMVPKSALFMPTSPELNPNNEDYWFHFQGNSLSSWGAFSIGKGYSAAVDLYIEPVSLA